MQDFRCSYLSTLQNVYGFCISKIFPEVLWINHREAILSWFSVKYYLNSKLFHCTILHSSAFEIIFSFFRLSVAFFCISGLDILNELEILGDKLDVINWIYSFQLISPESRNPEELKKCGFKGSLYATDVFQFQSGRLLKGNESRSHLDTSHIAMTYTGLSCLIIMGDDLSGVDRSAISAGIKALQLENGK